MGEKRPDVLASMDAMIALLNEAQALDPEAISRLVLTRVPCNEALKSHPAIIVREEDDGTCSVGIMGLVNALFFPQAKPWRDGIEYWDDRRGRVSNFKRSGHGG